MFQEPELFCGLCEAPIPGMTGLDELHNLMAHMGEHHEAVDMMQAMELRAEWEKTRLEEGT